MSRADRKYSLDNAADGEEVKLAILGYLRTHRNWYRRWSLFFTLSWNSFALAIVILGFATSILTAIDDKLFAAPKLLLIALPAVSSLLGAVLTQFRLRELARIRDEGRIRAEQLQGAPRTDLEQRSCPGRSRQTTRCRPRTGA